MKYRTDILFFRYNNIVIFTSFKKIPFNDRPTTRGWKEV